MTGEKGTMDWVVHDLCGWAPRAKGIGENEPSFGPMTEHEAKAMVARRPDFYYAVRLPRTARSEGGPDVGK